MQDEQSSSVELPLLPPRRYFAPKWVLGALAGVVVGPVWGAAAGCFLFDFDEFQKPHFLLYLAAMLASMTFTGIVIGVIRRWPELLGLLIGLGAAPVFFVVFWAQYLRPMFGILGVMLMLPIGAFGGGLTGLLLRLLKRFSRA